MTLSEFIDEIDFRVEYNDDEDQPEFTSFELNNFCDKEINVDGLRFGEIEISLGDITINDLLLFLEDNPDLIEGSEGILSCSEINHDYLNNLIHENIPQSPEMIGNSYLEKQGTNYEVGYDAGYGDVPEEYYEKIAEAIEIAFYSINLQEVIPFEIPYFDSDLDVSVDLSNIEYEDGGYDVIVSLGGEEMIITLILDGLEFEEVTYIPREQEILELLSTVTRLKAGTIMSVELVDDSPYSIPPSLNSHGILNMTTNQETGGLISFKVLKSEVENKSNVALYIWEGSWIELPTILVSENADYYNYEAQTLHFSIFMIAEIIIEESEDDDGGSSGDSSDDDDDGNSGGIYRPPTINFPEPDLEEIPDPSSGDVIGIGDQPEEEVRNLKPFIFALAVGIIILGIVITIVIVKRNKRADRGYE